MKLHHLWSLAWLIALLGEIMLVSVVAATDEAVFFDQQLPMLKQ